jgi:CobQ/CobB/MinD/ParA nucleotide binding domain
VLALLSQKGGSGKATLATRLSVTLGNGRRVLLVDTDPQRSAAWWRARQAEAPELVEATPLDITAALRNVRTVTTQRQSSAQSRNGNGCEQIGTGMCVVPYQASRGASARPFELDRGGRTNAKAPRERIGLMK